MASIALMKNFGNIVNPLISTDFKIYPLLYPFLKKISAFYDNKIT